MTQEDDHSRETTQAVEVGGRVEFVGGKRTLVVRPQGVGDETRKEGAESHVEGDGPSWTEKGRWCHAVLAADEARESIRPKQLLPWQPGRLGFACNDAVAGERLVGVR